MAWDGRSILPALTGKKQADPAVLFFHHARGKAIRVGNWKLVLNKDGKKKAKWELYDLSVDPNELKDLANSQTNKVKELVQLWESKEKECKERSSM